MGERRRVYFGNLVSENTGAPSVNHRIYGEDAFQIVERGPLGRRILSEQCQRPEGQDTQALDIGTLAIKVKSSRYEYFYALRFSLHEHHIQPAVEFAADLIEPANLNEAQRSVQAD